MTKTYTVDWRIEGSVDVEVDDNASEKDIFAAARDEIHKDARAGRGTSPGDIEVVDWYDNDI